ncbi:MAG TPA: helix-turn-helix domain-containing protein [Flavobacterium sp.]|jgi:AraC-like DNA-binding protein
MQNPLIHDQILRLYKLLLQIITGAVSITLHDDLVEPNHKEDDLCFLLKKVEKEMLQAISSAGYVLVQRTFSWASQAVIILDSTCCIISFNSFAAHLLDYAELELRNKSFTSLLAEQSIETWAEICELALSDESYFAAYPITFLTKQGKHLPSLCTITRLQYRTEILISTVQTVYDDHFQKIAALPRQSDAETIQRLYDYIVQNLEEPLPSVKELAKMLGTNEFKLKDGFRHFFNTSIYQLYHEERLKKAHMLIQQTALALKEIAFMSGFNDYTNFAKAFKKRFRYAPSQVLRGKI